MKDLRMTAKNKFRVVSDWDKNNPWRRVSFASECLGGDEDEFGDTCSICGKDYANECDCPGPTQDRFEYKEIDGQLFGREIE